MRPEEAFSGRVTRADALPLLVAFLAAIVAPPVHATATVPLNPTSEAECQAVWNQDISERNSVVAQYNACSANFNQCTRNWNGGTAGAIQCANYYDQVCSPLANQASALSAQASNDKNLCEQRLSQYQQQQQAQQQGSPQQQYGGATQQAAMRVAAARQNPQLQALQQARAAQQQAAASRASGLAAIGNILMKSMSSNTSDEDDEPMDTPEEQFIPQEEDAPSTAPLAMAPMSKSPVDDPQFSDLFRQAKAQFTGSLSSGTRDAIVSEVGGGNPFQSDNPFSGSVTVIASAADSTIVSVGIEHADGMGSAAGNPFLDSVHEGIGKGLAVGTAGNPFASAVAGLSNDALSKMQGQLLARMDDIGQGVNQINSDGGSSTSQPQYQGGNPFTSAPSASNGASSRNPFVGASTASSDSSGNTGGWNGSTLGAQEYFDPKSAETYVIPQGYTLYRDPTTLALSIVSFSSLSSQNSIGDTQYGGTVICSQTGVGIVVPQCEQSRHSAGQ